MLPALPPRAASTLRRGGPLLALAAALAAAAGAYAPALGGDFVFDDQISVTRKPQARSLDAFTARLDAAAVLAGRPVTDLSFALDAERGGLSPRAFHETSLLLHLVASALVFALGRQVLRRAGVPGPSWGAAAAAALFALHPVQTQAVAYVSQRSEVLASGLALASLLLLLAADRAARPASAAGLGAAAAVTFALGLGAKPVAVAVPVLFLLASFALPPEAAGPPRAHPWRRRAALAAPLVALAAVQAAALVPALRGARDVGFSVPGLDPWRYLLTQARVVPRYLGLLAFPAGQNVDPEIAPSEGLLAPPSSLAGALLLLGLAAAAVAALRWARGRGRASEAAPAARVAGLGVLWFLALLAPTSSVVPLADPMMEHRVYLASAGILLAAVALAALAARRVFPAARAAALASAAVVAAGALAWATHARAEVWADAVRLWEDAAAKSPGKSRALVNLGNARYRRGDLEGALRAYERGLALGDPRADLRQNMGNVLLSLGRPADARAVLSGQQPPEPETVVLLAFAAVDLGDLEGAERLAWKLVLGAPGYHRSHEAMGRVMEARGDLPAARDAYRRASALDPPDGNALHRLGLVEAGMGDREAACAAFARAAVAPGSAWVRWNAAAERARLRCP